MQPVATCLQSPYLRPSVIIVTSFSLWRRAPTALSALAAPILIMTSFATELATPTVTDVRTLPRLMYRDATSVDWKSWTISAAAWDHYYVVLAANDSAT